MTDIPVRETTPPSNAGLAQRMKRSASVDLTDVDIPGLVDAERERHPAGGETPLTPAPARR